MDRPSRYLEIPPGPDPSLNKPIDLSVPQYELSPAVREALEQARARIEAATAQASQQILSAATDVKRRVEPPAQPAPVTKLREVESRPVELSEPKQEQQPFWKRALGSIVNVLDYPGRVLTQAAIGIADVARQVWERGHPVEKAVGIPVLVAGSFALGAMGGVASLVSPKAWYETAVALAKPRETISGLKETIAENPLRAAAITGSLVAPVKLPKLAGIGVVERVKLVPEKMRVAVASESVSLARIEAAWPARTWRALEAEAELARRGLAGTVRAEPEQLAQLKRISKASEYITREVSQRVHTRFEQAELPVRYEVVVKDPGRLFKNYEAFVEVSGRAEVVGRRIGRLPEGVSLEVRVEDWVRAMAERIDWGVYERRIYAKDIEPMGFRKTKEFETFERLVVRGDRFEYAARIVDPEVAVGKARLKPGPPEEILRADRLLRVREVEVVRPVPGPPGVASLAHILKLPHAEEPLGMVKASRPATLIEASKLREPPVRIDVDAVKHIAEAGVRLEVRPPAAATLPAHHPGPPRVLEVVAHGVSPTPVVDVPRVEGFTTDIISSVGLPRFPEATPLGEPRVATRVEPETPRKAGQGALEGVVLPRVELGDVIEVKPRLGQPSVLKQLAVGAEPLPRVGLPGQPIVHAVKPKAVGALRVDPGLRTPERLDLGVRALEALELDVKQATPPELAEPGIPAIPTTRAQARARRQDKQELRIPSLTSELRKLKLQRWEWELPEWAKGLRKMLGWG